MRMEVGMPNESRNEDFCIMTKGLGREYCCNNMNRITLMDNSAKHVFLELCHM